MNFLIKEDIKKAIKRCHPSKIAVAYIGNDWNTFIENPKSIDSIVLSPTFGSNPKAICDIAKKIGWEKIYFLNELHTKLYLSDTSAVIGSANLTQNGLSGSNLFELCAEFTDFKAIEEISTIFEKIKSDAIIQYPSIESKKIQISALEEIWNRAIANEIIAFNTSSEMNFINFELLSNDQFYVCWYQPVELEHSDEMKRAKDSIADEIHFAVSDNVKTNKWVLTWQITDQNKPDLRTKLKWLYIHEVFEDAIIDQDYEYPRCAVQKKNIKIPPIPFEITNNFSKTFKAVVQEDLMSQYFIQGKNTFDLNYSTKGLIQLIQRIKDKIGE
jgi:hypothetical protein